MSAPRLACDESRAKHWPDRCRKNLCARECWSMIC